MRASSCSPRRPGRDGRDARAGRSTERRREDPGARRLAAVRGGGGRRLGLGEPLLDADAAADRPEDERRRRPHADRQRRVRPRLRRRLAVDRGHLRLDRQPRVGSRPASARRRSPSARSPTTRRSARLGLGDGHRSTGDVERIDPASNRVVKRIPTGNGAYGVVCAFGSVWVAGPAGPSSASTRGRTRSSPEIPVDGASWTAASTDAVWIATSDRHAHPHRPEDEPGRRAHRHVGDHELGDPAVVGRQGLGPGRSPTTTSRSSTRPRTSVARTVHVGPGPFVVTEIGGEAWVPSYKGADICAPP